MGLYELAVWAALVKANINLNFLLLLTLNQKSLVKAVFYVNFANEFH